jgi:hypothetical protein
MEDAIRTLSRGLSEPVLRNSQTTNLLTPNTHGLSNQKCRSVGPLKSMALDTLQVENQTWLTGEDEELQPIRLVSFKVSEEVIIHPLVHLVHVHASDYAKAQK